MANRIVAGRYEILKEVGRGGMSRVYLATDLGLNKNWAVKEIMRTGLLEGQEVSNSLLAEAEMMKNLDHPALPRIVDIMVEEHCYYIVMDYVEGENLKAIIDNTGPQNQDQVISWGMELASVLQYLHSQEPAIIYRDMKPANIILQPSGRLKLIDFGIARTFKAEKKEDTVALGTKGYAAPEQYNTGKGQPSQTDARTDIYNLGVTLYELLSCHIPTSAPYHLIPLRKLRPDISVGIERIIEKCTHPDPDMRFQNAEELMYALLNFEKYDEVYIDQQKSKLKKAVIPFLVGAAFFVMGIGALIADHILVANDYENLLRQTGNSTTRIDNLKKAIKLDPKRTEGYHLLVEEYAKGGLTENESEEILTVCNNGFSRIDMDSDAYLDINFMLGESFLVHYSGSTDNSLRNKIITASAFFDAVAENGNDSYEHYEIACAYSALASFYEDYILGGNKTFVFDADEEDYQSLLEEFDAAIRLLDASDNSENNQLKTVTYSIILSIIDSERSNMAKVLKMTEITKRIDEIEEAAKEGISTTNDILASERQEVIDQCETLRQSIHDTYNAEKQVEIIQSSDEHDP